MEQSNSTIVPYDFNQAKEEYRLFCLDKKKDIQVFAQPWFLDAVCETTEDWKVILYKEDTKIVAAFPFEYKKGKYGLWHIKNPWQAARLGIWIDYENKNKSYKREQFENEIVAFIIKNLPYYDKFQISFDGRFKNWQQFYRSGFQQKTHYSYIHTVDQLDEICSLKKIATNKKRQIKLFAGQDVIENYDFNVYWSFFEKSYTERGRAISYSKEQVRRLFEASLENKSLKIYYYFENDTPIAVEFFVYDSTKIFFLFQTFVKSIHTTPPTSYLTNHAIISTLKTGLIFDYQGSMIPEVAENNSRMGAIQEPYFVISNSSEKYKRYELIRSIVRFLRGKDL